MGVGARFVALQSGLVETLLTDRHETGAPCYAACLMRALLVTAALLASCASQDRTAFTVVTTAEDAPAISAFAATIPFPVSVTRVGGHEKGLAVSLVKDLADCAGCFRIDAVAERYTIHGGDLAGLQYGLAELFEAYGFRFFHPWQTHVPRKVELISKAAFGKDQRPEQTLRGLHLHTIHPIEAYFDFWEPSAENLESAKRTLDWTIKNRGNYVQWAALDNIQSSAAAADAWATHTRQIIDEAHQRGIKTGLSIQLFGQSSNLQKAFDLLDATPEVADPRAEMRRRLQMPLSLGFDVLNISFGEFTGGDAQHFIDRLNDVYAVATELSAKIEVTATIHVGKGVTATYDGKTLLYYFLVRYADPRIVPLVHTVMYYNLFEPAGGAYGHDDFSEHREFMLGHLKAGQRVVSFPESAYWVAWDNCVPTYLPLYVRSRWLELSKLREATAAQGGSPLTEHLVFSSGWEWGYWQTDAAVLRMGFHLPDTYVSLFEQFFAPYADAGKQLAAAIASLAELQHHALIQQGLAAYFAGRDAVMDAGDAIGVVAQPGRASMSALAKASKDEVDTFERAVVQPMRAFGDALKAVLDTFPVSDDRFFAEARDGAQIDFLRARFAVAAWSVPIAKARNEPTRPLLDEIDSVLAQAQEVVTRRRVGLHDSRSRRLLLGAENHTLYPYGYLFETSSLCFWQRERVQARALVFGVGEAVPSCIDVDP